MILGSTSPRRKEIFSFFKIPFEIAAPPYDESSLPYEGHPWEYVKTLSQNKGRALLPSYPQDVILTADTLVTYENKIYGKPKNFDEAVQFLKTLSSKTHEVLTALSLHFGEWEETLVESTKVTFHDLSWVQIQEYVRALNPYDKAGAYAIQGSGGLIVKKIEGCYYNVMGLPLNALEKLLRKVGLDLWQFLKPSL